MYRHTFYLICDERISVYCNNPDLPRVKYGDQTVVYVVDTEDERYTIPVMSVLYVKTEFCEGIPKSIDKGKSQ